MSREHEVLLVSTGPRQLADWLSRRACAVIDVAAAAAVVVGW